MFIKVACDCGCRYAFDVEPINGLMPVGVNCPYCGLDGTEKADALIALEIARLPSFLAVVLPISGAPMGTLIPPSSVNAAALALPAPTAATKAPQNQTATSVQTGNLKVKNNLPDAHSSPAQTGVKSVSQGQEPAAPQNNHPTSKSRKSRIFKGLIKGLAGSLAGAIVWLIILYYLLWRK